MPQAVSAPDPDLGVRREEADTDSSQAHEREGDDHGVLATELVSEMTEHHSADRTSHESHGKSREGCECPPHRRRRIREEQRAEHQGGCGSVDVEVEPFDGRSDKRRDSGLACLFGVVFRRIGVLTWVLIHGSP